MNVINNPLQLRRRECEEKRQYLSQLERLAARLQADAGRLAGDIEHAMASGDAPAAQMLAERHRKIELSAAAIDTQVAAARAALANAEDELRRSERAFAAQTGSAALGQPRPTRRGRRPARVTPGAAGGHQGG